MQTIVTVYLWNTYKVSWINSDNWKCYLHLTTNTSAFHPLHALETNRHECTQNTDPLSGPTDTTARCNNNAQAESDACEGTFLWAINTQKCWCFPSFLLLFFTLNFQSIWSYGPVIMLHEWRKWQKQWVQQFGKYSTIMDICMTEKIMLHKSVWLKTLWTYAWLRKLCYINLYG